MTKLRLATAADFRAYTGRDPDPLWCEQWFGFVAERDGELTGLGVVGKDAVQGRIWMWLEESRGPVSAFMLHRAVKTILGGLRKGGVSEVHVTRSQAIAGAEKWLRRLGFCPAPELTKILNYPVWVCDLSTN